MYLSDGIIIKKVLQKVKFSLLHDLAFLQQLLVFQSVSDDYVCCYNICPILLQALMYT